MKMIIEEELFFLKNTLISDFVDPFKDHALEKFLIGNSKFIRAKVSILYLKMQNIELVPEVYKILAAGEVLHNASLLHDDVIDSASLRRGVSTFSELYSPKVSILSGDYLITYAMKNLLDVGDKEIINLFINCTQKMCKAEIKQFMLRSKVPSSLDYLDICRNKTAELFATILESVCIITGLSNEQARNFAKKFGICFQIKNDLEKTSAKEDKKNEIYTALDVLGIEKTNNLLDNYKEEMRKILAEYPDNIYKKGLEDLVRDL